MIFAVSVAIASRHTLPELEARVDALAEEIDAIQMEEQVLPQNAPRSPFGRTCLSRLPPAQELARAAFDVADKDFDDKLSFAEFNQMRTSGTVTMERKEDDARDYQILHAGGSCNKCCYKVLGQSICERNFKCSAQDWGFAATSSPSCSACTAPTSTTCDGTVNCCEVSPEYI